MCVKLAHAHEAARVHDCQEDSSDYIAEGL